jgi:hypothetical protein
MLISLSDLQALHSFNLGTFTTTSASDLQNRLQQVMRQLHLKLPVQSLLKAEPVLCRLVSDVQIALPNALRSGKQLRLDVAIAAPLDEHTYVQVPVNIGFRHNQPKLFEWVVRQPEFRDTDEMSFIERVKLWAVTQHLRVDPQCVKLISVSLYLNQTPQTRVYAWDTCLQEQTRQQIASLLSENHLIQNPSISDQAQTQDQIRNILEHFDEIEEVPI